jgi:SAM-dependent methyltransferase
MRYPREVLAVLREHCGLRAEQVVADVGAGTGMLAELFLDAGNRVVAIEPNAEMRMACARLGERYAGLRVVDAAAEETGLGDASIDLVSVGRAFHWFDREKALAEFARILRPGGWVVLVANRRARDGSAAAVEYEQILMEHGTDYAEVRGGYRSFVGLRPYGDAGSFEVQLPGEQRLSLEEFLGQTQSLSIAPMPGDAKYEGMQKSLRDYFAKWSEDEALLLQTVCEVVGWRVPGQDR